MCEAADRTRDIVEVVRQACSGSAHRLHFLASVHGLSERAVPFLTQLSFGHIMEIPDAPVVDAIAFQDLPVLELDFVMHGCVRLALQREDASAELVRVLHQMNNLIPQIGTSYLMSATSARRRCCSAVSRALPY